MKQIMLLLLFVVSTAVSATPNDPAELPKIYVAGKQVSDQSTMIISTTGEMMLGSIDPVTGEKQTRKFRIVIKRTLVTAHFPTMVYDIRFNDGEVFETINIEKVLLKAQVGDEVLIVPVDDEKGKAPKVTSSGRPLAFKVTEDRC